VRVGREARKGERERGDAPAEKGFGARARAQACRSRGRRRLELRSLARLTVSRVRVDSAGREYARDESDKDGEARIRASLA